jgi:hypothetical protein
LAQWLVPELFDEKHALLVPDRSLSTLGFRRLQYFRSKSRWPSPNVYRFDKLALRILTERARLKKCPRPLPSWDQSTEVPKILRVLETVRAASFPYKSLRQVYESYRDAEHLLKFPLSAAKLLELLQHVEKQQEKSLSREGESLIFLYALRLASEAAGEKLSSWDHILEACQALDEEDLPWNWHRILERPPHVAREDLKILLDTRMELFPVEALLLRSLKRQIPVQDFPALSGDALDVPEILPSALRSDSTLFWAWNGRKAHTAETHERLSSREHLDLPESRPLAKPALLRALLCWLDFFEKSQPPLHPFRRHLHYAKILSEHGLGNEPTEERLEDFLARFFPSDFEKYLSLSEFFDLRRADDWHFLLDLSMLQESRREELLPRSHPEGLAILTLEDFPWCSTENAQFWGNRESLAAWCNPESSEVLARRLFSPQISEWLEAEGLSVPDPSREALRLRELLARYHKQVSLYSAQSESRESTLAPAPQADANLANAIRVTPTSLESYARCPKKFHFERILKLRDEASWDPKEIDVRRKGSWLHKSLELFFAQPDWENPAPLVEKYLRESLPEVFQQNCSAQYLDLIAEESPRYAALLAQHLLHFEKALAEESRISKRETEKVFSLSWKGFALSGKIDRIDHIPGGVLIWDYKTGSYNKTQNTLLKEGYLQWWLYKALWEMEHPELPVLGGGYLNPLRAERSRLIALGPQAEQRGARWKDLGFPCDIFLSDEDLQSFVKDFDLLSDKIAQGIRDAAFPPTPLKAQICEQCSFQASCGKVFLEASSQ